MLHAMAPSVASRMSLLDRWYAFNLATPRERPTGRQDMRVVPAATRVRVMPASLAAVDADPADVDVTGRW